MHECADARMRGYEGTVQPDLKAPSNEQSCISCIHAFRASVHQAYAAFCALLCLRNSTAAGSTDTTTMPRVTSEKFSRTTGTFPNSRPAPRQTPTHPTAPTRL